MCVDSKEQEAFHRTEVNIAVPQEAEMNSKAFETKSKIGLSKNFHYGQEELNQSYLQKKEDNDQSQQQGEDRKKEKKSFKAKDLMYGS